MYAEVPQWNLPGKCGRHDERAVGPQRQRNRKALIFKGQTAGAVP